MPDWLKGILTFVVATGLGAADGFLFNIALDEPLDTIVAILIGTIFGALYGLESGLLISYDLNGIGWLELIVDMTWSLPNTVWGFVLGNIIFVFVGNPSRSVSRNRGFIAFSPRGSGSFGNKILQTHGTVNLGGAGQHELVHVLQARIFGPLFLPIYFVNYVVNSLLQLIWTATAGVVLYLIKLRDTPYFRPPATCVVDGFVGWIYYYTVFEYWGYNS